VFALFGLVSSMKRSLFRAVRLMEDRILTVLFAKAGDCRWSNGLLSRYRRLRRSAVLRPSQCLWVCRPGGLHVVGGQAGCAYGWKQLKSATSHRNLRHLGRCARLPYGTISGCAENSTWPDGYYGAKQHLTRVDQGIAAAGSHRVQVLAVGGTV
jgi:hypothetical protein